MLEQAEAIIRRAGELATHHFHNRAALEIDHKGAQDLVSEADRAVERQLRDALKAAFPEDGVLGEEYGEESDSGNGVLWVIDPIDGTTNFLRGIPDFAITLCRVVNGEPEIGLIYHPLRDELLSAVKGQGAFINGQPHHISQQPVAAENALLVIGFSQRGDVPQRAIAMLQRWAEAGCVSRQTGAAATALSMVIQGQAEGYYEPFLYSWDGLAGQLIAIEAGLQSSALLCGEMLHNGGPAWVSRPELFDLVTPAR